MTKKHFKAIAREYETWFDKGQSDLNNKTYGFLIGVLKQTNPLFDEQRFYNACHGLPYKK